VKIVQLWKVFTQSPHSRLEAYCREINCKLIARLMSMIEVLDKHAGCPRLISQEDELREFSLPSLSDCLVLLSLFQFPTAHGSSYLPLSRPKRSTIVRGETPSLRFTHQRYDHAILLVGFSRPVSDRRLRRARLSRHSGKREPPIWHLYKLIYLFLSNISDNQIFAN